MPVFKNQENIQTVPFGDYILRTTAIDIGISAGDKTSGCPKYTLKIAIENKAGEVVGR